MLTTMALQRTNSLSYGLLFFYEVRKAERYFYVMSLISDLLEKHERVVSLRHRPLSGFPCKVLS